MSHTTLISLSLSLASALAGGGYAVAQTPGNAMPGHNMRGVHITISGKPDVDFIRGMIPHHQGAIDMAKVELAHGTDPEARKLAETIIQDQEREIAQMQAWLKAKGVE